MMRLRTPVLLVLLLLEGFGAALAQEAQRPKVAVVLSGGGAKGFTHIGVLKVLEEEGIPIDLIVGTSMGGIVGGLYSIGYSADEIAQLSMESNWPQLLSDYVPRTQLDEYSKTDQQRYVLKLPFSFDKKPLLPGGMVNGQNILNLFCGLTANVPYQADFTKFPIAFACVATDMSRGKEFVMDSGFMPTAIFSSMAIPGAFVPGEHNGSLLVDGGMADNFPTDVAKKMGADIIIGVDIRPDLFKPEEIGPVNKLFGQLVAFYSLAKDSLNNSYCNVIVKPDMEGYNSTSFSSDAVDTLIRRGKEATYLVIDKIRALKSEYHLEPRILSDSLIRTNEWKITNVTMTGKYSMSKSLLIDALSLKLPGTYNYNDIKKSIDNLYGMGVFKRVYFNLEDNGAGKTLNIHLEEQKVWNVNVGMRLNTQSFVSVVLNSTRRDYTKTFGLLSFTADVSSNPRFSLLAEIDKKKLPKMALMAEGSYSTPYIHLDKDYVYPTKLYTGSLKLYTYQKIQKYSTVGGGIKLEHYTGKLYTAINDSNLYIPDHTRTLTHLYGYYSFDNLDDYYFPRKGSQFYSEVSLAENINFDAITPIVLVKSRNILPVTSTVSLLLHGYWRSVFREQPSIFLGNFVAAQNYEILYNQQLPFYGLPSTWTTERTTLIGAAGIRLNYRKHYITFSSNVLLHNNQIFHLIDYKSIVGFGLTYAYKSPIGPIEVTLANSDKFHDMVITANIGLWY
ncbi:MAG TPA: patatin-like phospholipase family protein [Prolixibacteraceae bacterium]|nr:patatin-like phospholipase family protein [Prolixibacteraceae bacterium]